jgi:catalase
MLTGTDGAEIKADENFSTTASVLFDAVYVPGGQQSIQMLMKKADAVHFVNEAFKHGKPIAATGEGIELFRSAHLKGVEVGSADGSLNEDKGVLTMGDADTSRMAEALARALAQHRFWDRDQKDMVPA